MALKKPQIAKWQIANSVESLLCVPLVGTFHPLGLRLQTSGALEIWDGEHKLSEWGLPCSPVFKAFALTM